MEFIELSHFSKAIHEILTELEYLRLQAFLIERPDAGALIPGGGGLRKVRFGLHDKGKRGGARVIYFWRSKEGKIYLFDIYEKNVKTDLTPSEISQLAKLIKEME